MTHPFDGISVALHAYKHWHRAGTTMPADDAMTVREVVDDPKINDRTIDRLAGNGDLPGFKVGGSWRFGKVEIERWTDANAAGPGEESKWVMGER